MTSTRTQYTLATRGHNNNFELMFSYDDKFNPIYLDTIEDCVEWLENLASNESEAGKFKIVKIVTTSEISDVMQQDIAEAKFNLKFHDLVGDNLVFLASK